MKNILVQKTFKLWKNFTNGSVNRQIFGTAIIVGIVTAFVKVGSVLKELVIAWKFGTSDELDAFFIAFMIPSFVINIVAGSLQSSLIPTYIQVREKEGKKAAQNLFSGATVWAIVMLVVTTVIMLVTATIYLPLLARGFDKQKLDLTFKMLFAISPLILLNGIIVIWGSILNAGERFVIAAFTPVCTSVVTVILLLSFEHWKTFSLIAGLIVGAAIETVILGIALHRQGISLIPKWYGFDAHLRQVSNQYLPMMTGVMLMCSTGLVDQGMAAMLSPGSVAALNYGNRVPGLLLTFVTTALSTAVLPYFSKMVAHQDWVGIRRTLKNYLLLIMIASLPLAGILVVFSEPIVSFLFQRGSFTVSDTRLVAQIQTCYILQIPFYLGCTLLVRLISSINSNQILMYGAGINLIANIYFNYLFMQKLGIAGIALSTSGVYLISFSFLLCFVLQFYGRCKV